MKSRPFCHLPRVKLGSFPTPLDPLLNLSRQTRHGALYIKRDDLLSLGMGGNKIRNLEFWLGDAQTQGADVIIACGMLQSNQCRLAAAAAARLGLRCILVHNENRPDFYQGNMLLNNLMGAESIYLGPISETERTLAAQQLAAELLENGSRPYIIGEPVLGALGYANAALELAQQASDLGIDLQHVVIVGAMGVTAGGFLFGTSLLDRPYKVHVISVEYPLAQLRSILQQLFLAQEELTGAKPLHSLDDFTSLYEDYLGPGYAQPTPESLQATRRLARSEGVFVENVYNSKTLAGLLDLVEKGIIPPGEATSFIHTGGTPALFAQAELFQADRRN